MTNMTVMVVDDNSEIRFLCQAILDDLGHQSTIILSGGSEHAISLLNPEGFPNGLDLLVTDLDCPSKNGGLEVLAAADELAEDLGLGLPGKVLMSGRSIDQVEGVVFLQKPFTMQGLQEAATRAIHLAAVENQRLVAEKTAEKTKA